MKIAIQGHSTRGKEVIQILKSLGGKNRKRLTGRKFPQYYVINHIGDIDLTIKFNLFNYKLYTLEEFEKEFPFKIGDEVLIITGIPHKIIALEYYMGKLSYKLDNGLNYSSKVLTLYKEMKEERNITLALDKAKEWYKKGGELREIALQAFTEKELNPIPRSWEEFCDNYPVKEDEAMISCDAKVICCNTIAGKRDYEYKDIMPSQKSAEAHLAMIQLEQLRDCWRQGWVPSKGDSGFGIRFDFYEGFRIVRLYSFSAFLSFPTEEMAKEFLECFRDLIEKARDLI